MVSIPLSFRCPVLMPNSILVNEMEDPLDSCADGIAQEVATQTHAAVRLNIGCYRTKLPMGNKAKYEANRDRRSDIDICEQS